MNSNYKKFGALSLALMTTLAACGGTEDPQVGGSDNGDANNTSTNNTATNADPNNTNPNNTNPNNTNPNNTNPNNTNPNNTNPNNTVDPSGSVSFVQPADRTLFTNANAHFELAPEADAQDLELVIDGTTTLAELGTGTTYDWDTTSHAEGSYELDIRYTLGTDGVRWADDPRTIVVDRTSPMMIAQVPAARSADARPDAPISVSYDELLDPASVSAATVELTLNGSLVPHTATLSADGQSIMVDFDRTAFLPPYTVGVAMKGVTDLAGNPALDSYMYTVEAWRQETFQGALGETQFFVLGGSEYLVGLVQGSPDDLLRIYKNDGAGNWSQVAQQALGTAHDIAATQLGDILHIAVLRNDVISGTSVKAAQLYTFEPARNALAAGERVGVGTQTNSGEIAIHVRQILNSTRGAVAVADQGAMRVYKYSNGALSQSSNTFPTANYSNVRDEDLSVWVDSFGYPDVVFAACSGAAVPCTRTFLRRVTETSNGWAAAPTSVSTAYSAASSTCDEYTNFDVIRDTLGVPTASFSEYSPCDAPTPFVKTMNGSGTDWTNGTVDFFDTMPAADDQRYESYQAFDTNGDRMVLLASPTRLMVSRIENGTPVWMGQPASTLQPAGTPTDRFRSPTIGVGADGNPVITFRYNNVMHVLRAN